MAQGNEILVSVQPKGVFRECIVNGTPKPGTVMDLMYNTAPVNGCYLYEPAGTSAAVGVQGMAADGDRLPIAVLLPNKLVGGTNTDAYVSGDRGFLYYPLPGEELNMILENQSGTAEVFRYGAKLIVDDGTGKLLISASTPESEPFICLEQLVTGLSDDYLAHVLATGQ